MIRTKHLVAFALTGIGMTLAACTSEVMEAGSGETQAESVTATRAIVMKKGARVAPTSPQAVAPVPRPKLVNPGGGPVISNVKVVAVLWGTKVDATVSSKIGDFYSRITNSAYLDWLKEYKTATQTIGRGTLAGKYTITPGHTATSITDADIQAELVTQIDNGILPVQDANTLYMVHLPPGVVVTAGTKKSCVDLCAYHSAADITARSGTRHLRYAVMPDFGAGSGCDYGCGVDGVTFNNYTTATTHELVEAVTDPDPRNGWDDPNFDEIGDICNQEQQTVVAGGATYVVSRQWSNSANACVVSNPLTFSQPAAGCAKEIAAGKSPYVLGCDTDSHGDYHVYSWNGSAWTPENGYGKHIAVSPEGTPWIIDYRGNVKYYNKYTGSFLDVGAQGCATSIGVGPNNAAWIIGCGINGSGGNGIYKLTGGVVTGTWEPQGGAATQISVSPAGTPWVINAFGDVYAWSGSAFAPLGVPACATGVAVSEKDSWLLGCTAYGTHGNGIYRFRVSSTATNTYLAWDQVNGAAVKMAVTTDGTAWVVNDLGQIFRLEHDL